MRFEKKLVILSGVGGLKGTVSFERNAYGLFASLNLYHLPDLLRGEYRLGLKSQQGILVIKIGRAGRVAERFELDENAIDIVGVHCVVFDSEKESPVLYGTNAPQKLWAGNLMDGLRQKQDEENLPSSYAKLPEYTRREQNIRDYFFDITPSNRIEVPKIDENKETHAELFLEETASSRLHNDEETESLLDKARQILEYNDTALAEVNYYESSPLPSYSSHRNVDFDELLNPIDKYISDTMVSVQQKSPSEDLGEPEELSKPWQMQKLALDKIFLDEKNESRAEELCNKCAECDNLSECASSCGCSIRPTENHQTERLSNKSASYPRPFIRKIPLPGEAKNNVSVSKANTEKIFYEQIKSHLDGLFAQSERFSVLEELMPETKWVKIDFDESKYYVVGLVGKSPDYICYGVPALFSVSPPEELGDSAKWLPRVAAKPKGDGFWLMFQDAVSGEVES